MAARGRTLDRSQSRADRCPRLDGRAAGREGEASINIIAGGGKRLASRDAILIGVRSGALDSQDDHEVFVFVALRTGCANFRLCGGAHPAKKLHIAPVGISAPALNTRAGHSTFPPGPT